MGKRKNTVEVESFSSTCKKILIKRETEEGAPVYWPDINNGLFSTLGTAFFSPFTPSSVPSQFERYGGHSLPPLPIQEIVHLLHSTPSPEDSTHRLFHVEYYFVNGPTDPLIPVLQRRPFVLFRCDWVVDCIARSSLVSLEPYVVDRVEQQQQQRIKIEPESGSGSESGSDDETLPIVEPEREGKPIPQPIIEYDANLPSEEHASQNQCRPALVHSGIQSPSTARPSHRSHHESSTQASEESVPGIQGAPRDLTSSLRQVYVDPSAFTSRSALISQARAINHRKPSTHDDPSSPLTSLPEERDQAPRPKSPSPISARTCASQTPRRTRLPVQPLLEVSPNAHHMSSGTPPPPSTSSRFGQGSDDKLRRFRSHLRKKQVFDFEDVYTKLWDSETDKAKMIGLERA